MRTEPPEDGLEESTAEKVVARLGWEPPARRDLDALDELYGAWCRKVPFDNLRKLLALHGGGETAELPGIHAQDFFESWLEHGTGGTCWPSSNALFMLVRFCGFPARRVSASMLELGVANHGSVVVDLPEGRFLVDSSLLTGHPLPLSEETIREMRDPSFHVTVEPREGTWRLHFPSVTLGTMTCRLLDLDVSWAFYRERYEWSRADGPFNHVLHVQRPIAEGRLTLRGRTRTLVHGEETETTQLEQGAVVDVLIRDVGIARGLAENVCALELPEKEPGQASPGPDARPI